MPLVSACDFLAAAEPFYHVDRVADMNVLIYVTEGVIYVTEEGTDYSVRAGELLILKSGVHHWGKTEIPRGTKWYYIHFNCDGGDAQQFSAGMEIPPYRTVQCGTLLPKYVRGLSGGRLEELLRSFTEYYNGDDPHRAWYINVRLFELLSSLALHGDSAAQTLSDRVCAYLSQHKCEPFSAQCLSAEFYLSYKRLAAVFKEEKGITMQQYHTAQRMNEACRLLRSTLMTVGEVAEAVGYTDILYFSRRFSAETGCCPTEYRRRKRIY